MMTMMTRKRRSTSVAAVKRKKMRSVAIAKMRNAVAKRRKRNVVAKMRNVVEKRRNAVVRRRKRNVVEKRRSIVDTAFGSNNERWR